MTFMSTCGKHYLEFLLSCVRHMVLLRDVSMPILFRTASMWQQVEFDGQVQLSLGNSRTECAVPTGSATLNDLCWGTWHTFRSSMRTLQTDGTDSWAPSGLFSRFRIVSTSTSGGGDSLGMESNVFAMSAARNNCVLIGHPFPTGEFPARCVNA